MRRSSAGVWKPGWLLCFLFGMMLLQTEAGGVDTKQWESHSAKLSGILIPGFGSSRLLAWSMLDCPYSPMDFHPLDPVWLDIRKVMSGLNCWLKCMSLDPDTQKDHPECKSRADTGLSAITELDPGYITGPLSSIWREWVNWCVEFGIEADSIVAVPYDWRLSASMLEERDLYFHKLKLTFETARKLRGVPSLVFAHSLGNNVFRYFLEWLKLEIAPKMYIKWIDDHIKSYYAVGAPLLGAAETVKALLSGVTFGLPMSEGTARKLSNTFGSCLWMSPFSRHCHADHKFCGSTSDSSSVKGSRRACSSQEYAVNASGWPVDVLTVDFPTTPGVLYPGVTPETESSALMSTCTIPVQRSYSAHEFSEGTFFREVADFDTDVKRFLHRLKKFYHDDPILNPLTPWERPPIQNVYCMYGINLKSEVGYHFAPSGKYYPDNWIIQDIIYETEGGVLQARSGAPVYGNPGPASGDTTVPYHSLSWCKTWLGPTVNITRTPQGAHDGGDVQEELNVAHQYGGDVLPLNMTRDSRMRYITFYEDEVSDPKRKTAVWELDKVDHRNIVRSKVLLREMWLETMHSFNQNPKRSFASKARRDPMRDDDCFWDYPKARCSAPDHCEYRYVFGDVHLGQSCRLKPASLKEHIMHYL